MRKLLLLPLVPALLACRPVGTDYRRPALPLPDRFSPPQGAGADPWSGLHDPVLDGLVREALAAGPDAAAAEARLRQARGLQGVQDAQGGPSLGFGAKATRDRLSRNGEQLANMPLPNPKVDFTSYQAGFDASWELDVFGRTRRLAEGAAARTGAAEARLADVRLMVAAEVARTCIEARAWQARIGIAAESRADLDEQVRLARLSRDAGELSDLELQGVEAARESYVAALPALETGLRQSLAALSVLTGLPVEAVRARLEPARDLVPVPPPPAAGLPSDLLDRRPDLRAAEGDLAAATADVGAAKAALYPRFTLAGNGGWTSVQSGTLLDNASRTWSLGPQLSLPLFNRGLLRSQVRANEGALDAALAAYHKAVLTALADVDVAFTRMARCEERRSSLARAEALQARAADLTERQFRAGEVSRTAVLQARRALLEQRDQGVQAQAQSLTALISIGKALGTGWTAGRP